MSSSKLEKNICRICLKYKVYLNWNDEVLKFGGVSYKDCYYKYTRLVEKDRDFYPTNLCEKCSEELKNAHILFEKALESFKILQDLSAKYFDRDIINAITDGLQASEVKNMDDKKEENPTFLTLHALEKNSVFENSSKELNEMEVSEDASVQPIQFIDVPNFESSVEIPFEDHIGEIATSLITKRIPRKKVDNILPASSGQQDESSELLSSNTTKARRRKICNVLPKDRCRRNTTKDCKSNDAKHTKIESEDNTSHENLLANSPKPKRSREKYLLMCSYCSLKVDGAKKLQRHEATHNENRERKVSCLECGLKFYTDYSLSLHMKIHDANRQKTHKCEFCEKAFFNKGALNVHRRLHLGLMLKCQICEKDFFRQVDLNKHLLKHSASPLEKNVGKKKYIAQCQYCNKSILTDKLKEHIAIHLNQPQMKCKICDKNFFCRTKCTNHLRRYHLKKLNEYEDYIEYYVDRNNRLSTLMVKQKLVVKQIK